MVNLLKSIDTLGENFELRYGKSKTLKTSCGGCVTILASAWLLFTFIFFISQLFDSTELELSNSEQYSELPPKINMYENMILPIVGSSAGVLVKKEITPKVFTFKLSFTKMEAIEGSTKQKFTKTTFDFTDCAKLKERGLDLVDRLLESAGATTKEFVNDFGLCPDIQKTDMENLFIQGNLIHLPYTIMTLEVYPCSLSDNTQCAPEEGMTSAEAVVMLPQISFDPENKENPLFTIPVIDYKILINPKITVINKIFVQQNEIFDDTLDFFPEKLKEEYSSIDRVVEDSIMRPDTAGVNCEKPQEPDCTQYAKLIFEASGKKLVMKRNYVKVFNTLGELGGMRGVIIMLIGLGYGTFCGCFQSSEILEEDFFCGKKNYEAYKKKFKKEKKSTGCCGCGGEDEDAFSNLKDENEDGIELMKVSQFVKLMSLMGMKDHHLKLVTPLMVMNIDRMSQKNEMGYQQAYQNFLAYQPKNEIEKKIRGYIMENLPEWLKKEGSQSEVFKVEDLNQQSMAM